MRINATPDDLRALLRLADIDARADQVDLSAASYRRKRTSALNGVRSDLLERYQTLFERGRWPAISSVFEGACMGCHLRLPIQLDSQIRNASDVFTCPFCHRMIYAPRHIHDVSESAKSSAVDRRTPRRTVSAAASATGDPS